MFYTTPCKTQRVKIFFRIQRGNLIKFLIGGTLRDDLVHYLHFNNFKNERELPCP